MNKKDNSLEIKNVIFKEATSLDCTKGKKSIEIVGPDVLWKGLDQSIKVIVDFQVLLNQI